MRDGNWTPEPQHLKGARGRRALWRRVCLPWGRSLAAGENKEGGWEEDAAWPGRPLQELAAASASASGTAEGPPASPRVRVGVRPPAGPGPAPSRRSSRPCSGPRPLALLAPPSGGSASSGRLPLRESAASLPGAPLLVSNPPSSASTNLRPHLYDISCLPEAKNCTPL